ncbi:MAG: hypothetical protein AAF384_06510 [Pseudomonadota bacterium]
MRIFIGLWLSLSCLQPALAGEFEQRITRKAVVIAAQIYDHGDYFDKIAAATVLADAGDKGAFQFLVENLDNDDWTVLRSALDGLLALDLPDGADLLQRYAADAKPKGVFLKFLSESLASRPHAEMGELVFALINADDVWVQRHALQALLDMPIDDKADRVREFLEDGEHTTNTLAYANLVLLSTGDLEEPLEKLTTYADSGQNEAQEIAAVGFGMVDSEQTKEWLDILRDDNGERVKLAATASAAARGDDDAIARIVHIIAASDSMHGNVAAAALRRMPPDIALEISRRLMSLRKLRPDPSSRLIEAWGWIDADPKEIYEWSLGSAHRDVQLQGIWLVGHRRDLAYLENIIPFLDAEEDAIQVMAAWAVMRLIGEHFSVDREA